jgi:hypothetical protein
MYRWASQNDAQHFFYRYYWEPCKLYFLREWCPPLVKRGQETSTLRVDDCEKAMEFDPASNPDFMASLTKGSVILFIWLVFLRSVFIRSDFTRSYEHSILTFPFSHGFGKNRHRPGNWSKHHSKGITITNFRIVVITFDLSFVHIIGLITPTWDWCCRDIVCIIVVDHYHLIN